MSVFLIVAVTRRGRYLIDWSGELHDDVGEIGDGTGFDDFGIAPPPGEGVWRFDGVVRGGTEDDTLNFEGSWAKA
jgi:hypothetical protein